MLSVESLWMTEGCYSARTQKLVCFVKVAKTRPKFLLARTLHTGNSWEVLIGFTHYKSYALSIISSGGGGRFVLFATAKEVARSITQYDQN